MIFYHVYIYFANLRLQNEQQNCKKFILDNYMSSARLKMQTKKAGIFVAHCGFSETLYSCGFGGGGKYVRHILK